MATGFPAVTGDIFTAADYNGLVTFDVIADKTNDYTVAIVDSYQVLVSMNKATAVALKIPTNATAASPTLAQYKSAALIKTATNTWYVVGAIG